MLSKKCPPTPYTYGTSSLKVIVKKKGGGEGMVMWWGYAIGVPIPEELGQLTQLKKLHLSHNRLPFKNAIYLDIIDEGNEVACALPGMWMEVVAAKKNKSYS